MPEPQPADVFDTTGEKCAKMLLKIRARMNQLAPGSKLIVLSDDPVSIYDLPVWCHMTSHDYFGYEQDGTLYTHTIGVTPDTIRATSEQVWADPRT